MLASSWVCALALPLIKTILYIGQNRLFFAVVNYAHRAIGENRFYFGEILPCLVEQTKLNLSRSKMIVNDRLIIYQVRHEKSKS